MEKSQDKNIRLTARIIKSYLSNHKVNPEEIPSMIQQVFQSFEQPQPEQVKAPEPAVPIKKSVTHDYIICLEDGRKFRSMRRHLRATYDMSPADYRKKWNLPADYPMVAPAYAQKRQQLAKQFGLGQRRGDSAPE